MICHDFFIFLQFFAPHHFYFLLFVCSRQSKCLTFDNFTGEIMSLHCNDQRWSRGNKARGQGQGHKKNPRPRPRTAFPFPRTDTLEAKDRNAQGQGHKRECSPKKKKRSSQKIFRRSPKKKKVFTKIFQAISAKKRFPKNFFKRFTKF